MPAKRPRPTDPIIEQRIAEILQLRLDGAEAWDVRRYVAAKEAAGDPPWAIPDGESPLSERQIRRYVQSADAQISATLRSSRATLLRRHVALRKNLYRRALEAEDFKAAQSILADLAKLEDLYPANKVSVNVAQLDREIEQFLAELGHPEKDAPGGEPADAGGGNPAGPDGA